jgi:isocitrate dehydrogenase
MFKLFRHGDQYKATDLVVSQGTKFTIKVTLPDGKIEEHEVFDYKNSGGILMGM